MNLNIWEAMRPSSPEELLELEQESYSEGKRVLTSNYARGKKALDQLVQIVDLRKIAYDMYVWQRVDAVKAGIVKALGE